MKVAFVGTCQVHSMAAVARCLMPDAEIVSHHLNAPLPWEEIDRQIQDCDFAVSQFPDAKSADGSELPLSAAALSQVMKGAVFQPPVVFTGFHPDTVYLFDKGVPIEGAHSQYHSQIILGGFVAGLDVQRTAALFNAHVFAELSYFDAYDVALKKMRRAFVPAGYRLPRLLRRARVKQDVFMHTLNHPTIAMMEQLTVAALSVLGLVDHNPPSIPDIPDPLADSVVLPVYPPLARRLGITGSDQILRSVHEVGPSARREVTLHDYVERFFTIYRATDPEKLRGSAAEPVIARIAELLG